MWGGLLYCEVMDPRVRTELDEIWSLLHAMAERENQMEIRFNRRMERAEQRMERAEQRMDRADQRMDRAEQRMEKFDRRLEATRKLVEAGMKLLLQLGQRQKAMEAEFRQSIRELNKSQKAFLDSLRRGGNGSRHTG